MDEERPHESLRDAGRPFFRRRDTWLLFAGLCLLPLSLLLPIDPARHAGAGLDPAKVKLGLGIFFCIGFLWISEALPLAVTALLVPVLAALCGAMDLKSSLAGFADPLIFLFLGGFALATAMSVQGLDRWLAGRIVTAGRGDFLRVSYLLFGVTAVLSMWMSNTATTAMMIPLVMGISKSLPEGSERHRNTVYLLLGVAYAASVGGLGTVVGSPPNGIAARELGIGFGEWLRFGVPAVLVLVPLMVVLLRVIFRPRRVVLEMAGADEGYSLDRGRKCTLAIFAATALCWISGAKLAPLIGAGGTFDSLVALLAVLALVACRCAGWRDIERGTEWGVLLLFGGGITLSAVLSSTGASLFLAREFTGLVREWPAVLIVAAVVGFVIFLTELSSNTATAALLVPIFAAVAAELGMPAAQLVVPLALAASCAFMLPVATPPNAIVFATGMVPQRAMLRAGLVLNLVFIAALTLVAAALF